MTGCGGVVVAFGPVTVPDAVASDVAAGSLGTPAAGAVPAGAGVATGGTGFAVSGAVAGCCGVRTGLPAWAKPGMVEATRISESAPYARFITRIACSQ